MGSVGLRIVSEVNGEVRGFRAGSSGSLAFL